jgi:hypothetical protein
VIPEHLIQCFSRVSPYSSTNSQHLIFPNIKFQTQPRFNTKCPTITNSVQYNITFVNEPKVTSAKHWRFRALVKVNLSLQLSRTVRLISMASCIPYRYERDGHDRLFYLNVNAVHTQKYISITFYFQSTLIRY